MFEYGRNGGLTGIIDNAQAPPGNTITARIFQWSAKVIAGPVDATGAGAGGFKRIWIGDTALEGTCAGMVLSRLPDMVLPASSIEGILKLTSQRGREYTFVARIIKAEFGRVERKQNEESINFDFVSNGKVTLKWIPKSSV